ncbi:hypothetical protein [Bordetella sp. LUAb4]|uniref:hypothetical protein n=1 Tax=Bordetella sp. LUAb4 TaxID=2843195 RepID=UPI001E2B885D|nr:hypothetical protein [Bordetella sp. LUAb4]
MAENTIGTIPPSVLPRFTIAGDAKFDDDDYYALLQDDQPSDPPPLDNNESKVYTNSRRESCDAIMREVGILGTMSAANSDKDQRTQIENAAAAGRQGAEEMKKAAWLRLGAGLAGALAAGIGAGAAAYCAFKAAPGAKTEISANTAVKEAMAGEKEFGGMAKDFEQMAAQSRAQVSELQESQAGLKKMVAEGKDMTEELGTNSKLIEQYEDDAKTFDTQAGIARDIEKGFADARAAESLEGANGSALRNYYLELSRTWSTGANAGSALSSAGGSIAGFADAAKAQADTERNQADSIGNLNGSTKQSMYSYANDTIANQKALNQAENQARMIAMQHI